MDIRPICAFPEPVLTRRTQKVTSFDASLPPLVEEMIAAMRGANGVGLAANQLGVPIMLCVIEIPEEPDVRVFVNPELVSQEGERDLYEGCLSVPGYRGKVSRSVKVKVRYQDLQGRKRRLTATDNLLAQALEHEIGHLNGRIYLERLVAKDAIWKLSEGPPPKYAPESGDEPDDDTDPPVDGDGAPEPAPLDDGGNSPEADSPDDGGNAPEADPPDDGPEPPVDGGDAPEADPPDDGPGAP